MKPERVCEISLKFQPSNIVTTHLHPSKLLQDFNFTSFLLSSTKTNHYLPLQEACGKKKFKIAWKLFPRQEKAPNDPSPLFKKKEKGGEGGSKLGGQWNVPCLVANGRFHAWWLMECSMLGGQWKVPCLVANGMFHVWWPLECSKLGGHWNVPSLVAIGRWRKNSFSPLPFSPNNFTCTLNFFLWPHSFTLPWS